MNTTRVKPIALHHMVLADLRIDEHPFGPSAHVPIVLFSAPVQSASGRLLESPLIAVHEIKNSSQGRHGQKIGPCFLSGEDPDITSLPEELPGNDAEQRTIRTPQGDRQVFANALGRQELPQYRMNGKGGEFKLFQLGCPYLGSVSDHHREAVTGKGRKGVEHRLAVLIRPAPGGFGIQTKTNS